MAPTTPGSLVSGDCCVLGTAWRLSSCHLRPLWPWFEQRTSCGHSDYLGLKSWGFKQPLILRAPRDSQLDQDLCPGRACSSCCLPGCCSLSGARARRSTRPLRKAPTIFSCGGMIWTVLWSKPPNFCHP